MTVNIIVSLLATAGFVFALRRVHLVPVARGVMRATTSGIGAITNSELDDDAKEIAVRRAGFDLIRSAFSLFWRIGLCLVAATAPIFIADVFYIADRDAVIALMLRWDFLITITALAILLGYALNYISNRNSKSDATTNTNRYSNADQLVHMLAFSSPVVLKAASALEDRLMPGAAIEPVTPPIFITSLARGGTTAVLNAFHSFPTVATHTYRDMPFLTTPTLWDKLAGGPKRGVERHQRAHGDGIEIDLDSPEAFEEVLWKMFWPEKFKKDRIRLWYSDDCHPKADAFFRQHMAKVLYARKGQKGDALATGGRYCSKNNANIARLSYLKAAYPDSAVIVPIRRPETHAASLLRQHKNFVEQQARDDFIRRYMRDIGHFEFGLIHKPFDFDGFDPDRFAPENGNYWLHYWTQAFHEVARHRDNCIFVFQDDLRSNPRETMMQLCERAGVQPGNIDFSGLYHAHPDQTDTDVFDPHLLEEASELYRSLRR
jgi:hypothetical protein